MEFARDSKHRLTLFNSYDYRTICFFCACLMYGFFGSPTPNHYSLVEITIALLLIVSVGIGRFRDAVMGNKAPKRYWKSAGQAYLIYGLSIPFVIGALNGASLIQMLRDVLPFLFLFLPLFLLPLIKARPHYYKCILVAVLWVGFLFSVRSLASYIIVDCPLWCNVSELYYLENMPTVLFFTLLCLGGAIHYLYKGVHLRGYVSALMLLMLSIFPLMAMVMTLQRASIGAVFLYIVIISAVYFVKSPVRFFNVIFVFTLVFLCVGYSFGDAIGALFIKTEKVGLNMRPQEFAAVWGVVTENIGTLIFGKGWGAQFYSPAVGGLLVSYTHNFFTSVLLKTGLLGIILSLFYIVGLLERLSRVIIYNPVIGIALAAPIFIDLTLYASFKSLDFGLVLLLVSASLVFLRQQRGAPDV